LVFYIYHILNSIYLVRFGSYPLGSVLFTGYNCRESGSWNILHYE